MIVSISGENLHRYSRWTCGVTQSGINRCFWFPSIGGLGDIPGTYGCFRKSWYPYIIHFNRVFNYFHHPFWGFFSPLFLETPHIANWLIIYATDLPTYHLFPRGNERGRNGTGTSLRSVVVDPGMLRCLLDAKAAPCRDDEEVRGAHGCELKTKGESVATKKSGGMGWTCFNGTGKMKRSGFGWICGVFLPLAFSWIMLRKLHFLCISFLYVCKSTV